MRTLTLAGLLVAVGGCSEYLDRRDPIAASGGNAVATDVVTQMVDPWPRDSANHNIAFSGPRMETAIERYRQNKVITPRGIGTSSAYQEPAAGTGGQNNGTPVGPSVTQPAAPVK
ncbi:MAG TPA: hypothetical protein VEH02_02970, partial [Pseudolabrys sp.]|nr:hypothetical protein [Pseudolabrys sp.]